MTHGAGKPPGVQRNRLPHSPAPASMPLASQMLVLTLALALAMRFLVSILGLPGILNFAFFPVLIFGVLISRPRGTVAESRLTTATVLISLAVIASTLANFVNPLAAALLWASLATPFLLMRLAVTQGHQLGTISSLDRLVILFLFIQGGAIAFERLVLGQSGDAAQGFLRNQGAGHHVVGFIGVGTALYLGMRLIEDPTTRRHASMFAAVATGMAMGAITGTSQSLLAGGVVGITYLLTRRSRWPTVIPVLVSGGLLITVFATWSAFTPTGMNWYGDEFLTTKSETADAIRSEYQELPYQIFFGLGPGTTATKVAWTGALHDNLTAALDIRAGEVSQGLLDLERVKPVTRTSSLTSPWSTWLGVWGDLGLFGLVAYAWSWVAVARSTLGHPRTHRAGLYLVLYLVLLGVFYNWLEEPVLTIFLGLAVAGAAVRASDSTTRDEVLRAESAPVLTS